jgi:hypothetical protein
MAAPTFLARVLGRTKEILSINSSAGAGDADKLVATNSAGKVDLSFLPSGTGPSSAQPLASEALAAGDLVNLWDNGTDDDAQVRKADADSAGKEAHGFVLSAYSQGDRATVYFEGTVTGLTGKSPGARQFLSATAGEMTETAPTGANVISQCVGIAISDTEVEFLLEDPIILAQ